ncbi:tRNA 2-selenouridine(34) synthase MnmH [Comamonadaceae bacterium M7527]|nr:tRNA 2-selenouridine(34) synthase MnmH [Comamonadaceae bacterium M7527]
MPINLITAANALAKLDQFDDVIDARSPGEYALDAIPGAVNWPSLDDEQRIVIGTMYKQTGGFEAKKAGAALVARNIAAHIEQHASNMPRTWQPLLYCWRGGNRSGSLATVLSAIGFKVSLIEGGYKAFRATVMAQTPELVKPLQLRVVAGATGVGKTHVLHALEQLGAQTIDLEGIAKHRSSVLGIIPGTPQPSQKAFETQLWHKLQSLDPSRPVYIESESKRVGNVTVPESLITAMRASPCHHLSMNTQSRVRLLMRDYDFFVNDSALFCERLDTLVALLGHATIEQWQDLARNGESAQVVAQLLDSHYDPKYFESMARNFALYTSAHQVTVADDSQGSIEDTAAGILAFDAA